MLGIERLNDIVKHYEELMGLLQEPGVTEDAVRFQKLLKEQAELSPIVDVYKKHERAVSDETDALDMLEHENDPDMREMLKSELSEARRIKSETEDELQILLLPKDPNDDKNIFIEIRAGVGGDESALFAYELYRMYTNYAMHMGWKTEIQSFNENGLGGFKEVTFMVTGKGAYSKLKYESGVHRVQRVPETESGGRIHTSTATVAVMPEADEIDVKIDPNDIKWDVFRASGNGGQCVNTTDSAVRLTHFPSGIVIHMQEEKSQLQNKEKAMRILRSRLYEIELERKQNEEADLRRSQIGTGDRSEKIRTYNFPQSRVTDHRIKLTLYKIDQIINGDLDELINALITADQAAKLSKMNG
ncbi:MAG: peptide chain release factor 1 [Lachnospiraceae bacterium]|nr:peptide chain release factor 1 [Lachnospiraceae bacterium]